MLLLARGLPLLLIAAAICSTPAAAQHRVQTERNSIGIELVGIAAGEFSMGGHETAEELCAAFAGFECKPEEFRDEYSRHAVRITQPFLMGRHEVTVGQFRQFAQGAKFLTQAETDGQGGWGYDPETGKCVGRDVKFHWRSPGFPQTDDHPVINVTWNDAAAFCDWLSKKEGRTYRLPTEAEWEYACRAGTSSRYFHSDDPAELLRFAHLLNGAQAAGYADVQDQRHFLKEGESLTAKVSSKQPNAWGLYDMLGNAWEWTGDWYAEDYYARSPTNDPPGPASGSVRVRRGGAWNSFPLYARVAFRNWNSPNTRCINVGFRVVCEKTP